MTDIVDALRDPISMSMFRRKDDMIGYLLAIRGESAAEIERLRLSLSEARATGRREGMEEAAKIIDHLNGWGADCGRGGHAEHFADAIRAAMEKAE